MIDDAYVLCEDGDIAAVGQMRDLAPIAGDVNELDGRDLCAVPGLVDCHTHACFLGDRVEEFALRAAGASYEELHAAGGGIMSTVRSTRAGTNKAGRVYTITIRATDLAGNVTTSTQTVTVPHDQGH